MADTRSGRSDIPEQVFRDPQTVTGSQVARKQDKTKQIVKSRNKGIAAAQDGIPAQDYTGIDQGAAQHLGRYPTQLMPKDERDEKFRLLQLLKQGGQEPFGQITMPEDTLDWLKSKENALEAARLEKWLLDMMRDMGPADVQRLVGAFPELIDQRMSQIDMQLAIQRRMAQIDLRGPKEKEDYYFLYAVNTGRIPKDVLTTSVVGGNAAAAQTPTFASGLWSPRRLGAISASRYNPVQRTAWNADLPALTTQGSVLPLGLNYNAG